MTTIKVNGKDYKIKFDFKANKIMADQWGIKTPNQLAVKMAEMFTFKNDDISFDQMEKIGDFVVAGVKSIDPDTDLTADDVMDEVWRGNSKLLPAVLKQYEASMPKAAKPGNVNKAKKK